MVLKHSELLRSSQVTSSFATHQSEDKGRHVGLVLSEISCFGHENRKILFQRPCTQFSFGSAHEAMQKTPQRRPEAKRQTQELLKSARSHLTFLFT